VTAPPTHHRVATLPAAADPENLGVAVVVVAFGCMAAMLCWQRSQTLAAQ
jgi:hypothetical protein